MVLPPVDRVVGEHDHTTVALHGARHVHGERPRLQGVGARHETREHRFVTADVAREHIPFVGDSDLERRAAHVLHRDHGLAEAVEHRMLRTRDRGFHQGTLRREPRHGGLIDRSRPTELDRQTRGFADRDQRTTRREERGDCIDAGLTEAAREILRLAVHAEELVLVVLEIRLRACGRRLHHRLPAQVLLGHQDHVVVLSQVPLHHALLVDQVVRNLELVERETIPAQILRAGPLRVDGDPRHIGVVHRYRRCAAQHGGGESQRIHQRTHPRRILAIDHKRTGRERRVAGGEALLGHLHRHRAQQIAQRDHVVRAGVRHGDGCIAAAACVALQHDLVDR